MSCGSGSSPDALSPEATVNEFLTAIQARDFEKAKTFASHPTDANVEGLKNRWNMLKEMGKENEIVALFGSSDFKQDIEVKNCKETGDTASCDCCEKVTGECNSLKMIKENGAWRIHQPKEVEAE